MSRSRSSQLAPWQVWWANFDPRVGHDRAGRRPVIVVGTALACSLPNGLVVVVPCTGTDRGLPYQPAVSIGDQLSYAMCDQVRALSRNRLIERHRGSLSTHEVEEIRFALAQIVQVR